METLRNIIVASVTGSVAITRYSPQYSISGSYALTGLAIFLALFTPFFIYKVYIWPSYLSPLRHLPQPPGKHHTLGHAKTILKEPTGYPARVWNNTIPNDGLFRYMHWLNQERLVVTGTRAISEVLVTKNYDFVKPWPIRAGLGRLLGVGILLAEGDEHKRQRKALAPAFSFRHVKDLYPIFWQKSVALIEQIQKDITTRDSSWAKEANVVEVHGYTSRAALDIIGVAGLGRDFGALQDPENQLTMHYQTMFNPPKNFRVLQMMSLVLPPVVMRNLPIKRNRQMNDARAHVRAVCKSLIETKRAKLEMKEPTEPDILSIAMESGSFDDENLINQMMTFLVAGHETTSTALLWAIYALSRRKDAQTRLRGEVHARLTSPRTEEGKQVNVNAIESMPYLAAVCNEVLRLHAPVSMTLRVADKDTTVLDQPVPKGTTVILCPWATNTAFKLWGEDAYDFKPERWLKEGQANKGGAESNFAFLTFIHGPRSCIGEKFARAEFMCLLACLVGRFEWDFEDENFEPEVVGGITAKPKGGLWVRAKQVQGW